MREQNERVLRRITRESRKIRLPYPQDLSRQGFYPRVFCIPRVLAYSLRCYPRDRDIIESRRTRGINMPVEMLAR